MINNIKIVVSLKSFFILIFSLTLFLWSYFSYGEEENPSNIELPAQNIEFKEGEPNNNENVPSDNKEPAVEQNIPEVVQEAQQPNNQESAPQISEEESKAQEAQAEEERELRLKIRQRIRSYQYDPVQRVDPFTPPVVVEELGPAPEEAVHPLEKVSIDDLSLKAIIWSDDGVIPRALFETKDGKAYTVSKNDSIGDQGFVISRVDIDRVWYMKFSLDPITQQDRYIPDYFILEKNTQQTQGDYWYERY